MTAAVIPSSLLPPDSTTNQSASVRHVGDLHHGRPAGRKSRTPYLAAVPECEPPFDDEIDGLRPAPFRPSQPAGIPDAGDAGPDQGLADDPATGAALFDTPPRADQARADRTAQFDGTGQFDGTPQFDRTAQFDGAGQFDGTPQFDRTAQFDGTAQFDDTARVHGPARPQRAPRPGRSTGPRPTAPTGVLLLEHPRTAKPTTILARGVPSWSSEADIGVRKTASEHLPPAHRAASVLARALVEVLSGQRPLAQLRVHCAPEIYAGLGNRAAARQLALPHLLTVRVCEPADGVAEVSVAYRRADRVKALAFRIEGVDGRWRITALQLG